MARGVPPLSTWQWGKGVPLQHSAAIRIQQSLLQPCGGGETLEGKSQTAPAVNRNRESRSPQTTNISHSVFSLFVLAGCCSNPISYSLHTHFFRVPVLFCFDFHTPLQLQTKPMRGKSNNRRADACHHLVCLTHGVINVFCRVLCKARICP